jgi:P27 family predicted phage terminase small subunit
MARGRKPKPTWLKVIAGNPGRRPLNEDEPVPTGDLSAPPEWFDDSQKAAWSYAVSHAPEGLLKRLDREVMVAYAVASALHRLASTKVAAQGPIVKTKWGIKPNPYMAVQNKQAVIMMRAAAELGFTPSARSRVKVSKGKAAGQNQFEGLKEFDG